MATRDQGRIETSLARGPFWQPRKAKPQPFTGKSLLGSHDVAIRPARLSSRDLAVLAFVIDRYLWPPPASDLDPAELTIYDLGRALYGREPAGKERRDLRASLMNLFRAEIRAESEETQEWSQLVIRIRSEMDRLAKEDHLEAGRKAGALRGSTFSVWLDPWLARAVREGHFTWLNFRVLRRLQGLSARLWVYLEAENWKHSAYEQRETTWIGLGRPALATLGADGYARHVDARKALKAAGQKIVRVDPRYESITIDRRGGGWCLVAVRVTGERRRVRQAIRDSLRGAAVPGDG